MPVLFFFFFFNDTATTEIYTLSLHDALPIYEEYTVLTDYLGGTSVAGGKMKETGLDHWNSPNTGATNESGFTGLPAGYRSSTNGAYGNMGNYGYFWSSSESSSSNAWSRRLYSNYSYVYRYSNYEDRKSVV